MCFPGSLPLNTEGELHGKGGLRRGGGCRAGPALQTCRHRCCCCWWWCSKPDGLTCWGSDFSGYRLSPTSTWAGAAPWVPRCKARLGWTRPDRLLLLLLLLLQPRHHHGHPLPARGLPAAHHPAAAVALPPLPLAQGLCGAALGPQQIPPLQHRALPPGVAAAASAAAATAWLPAAAAAVAGGGGGVCGRRGGRRAHPYISRRCHLPSLQCDLQEVVGPVGGGGGGSGAFGPRARPRPLPPAAPPCTKSCCCRRRLCCCCWRRRHLCCCCCCWWRGWRLRWRGVGPDSGHHRRVEVDGAGGRACMHPVAQAAACRRGGGVGGWGRCVHA